MNRKKTITLATASALATAAMTGLFAGSAQAMTPAQQEISALGITIAMIAGTQAGIAHETEAGKHNCKGQNACKGQGGCKSGDNGCKGKNSCKGAGGCASEK